MGFEDEGGGEKLKTGKKGGSTSSMTLQKAIELGEYDPDYLATFPEWHTASRHVQFQYVKQALDNRRHQLLTQWAEINNMLDFHLKPQLKSALENLNKQLKNLERDREKLYVEYSK